MTPLAAPAPVPDVDVVTEPTRAATVLDPLRQRLLVALGDEPDSAAGLARRLGESRQRVNYHLRELERAGFAELVEERRKGNTVERIVRATARHYVVDPAALGALAADPDRVADRFSSAFLVALAARAIRELARQRAGAEQAGERLATLSLDTEVRLASPAELTAFTDELAAAVAEVVARHHDQTAPGGRSFRLVAGVYPRPVEGASDPIPEEEG